MHLTMKQTTTDLQNKTKIRPQLTRSEHNLEIPFWIVPELEEHPLLLTEGTNKANRRAKTGPTTMIKKEQLADNGTYESVTTTPYQNGRQIKCGKSFPMNHS
jgi:hypothetical protein